MQSNNAMDQKLCAGGCGFWGSSATNEMCSKCWRESVHRQEQQLAADSSARKELAVPTAQAPASDVPTTAAEATPAAVAVAGASASVPAPPAVTSEGGASSDNASGVAPMVVDVDGEPAAAAAAAATAEEASDAAAEPLQKNRKRCFTCNKKVGLTGIECRCKLVFCGVHRYPEQHSCEFDFKTADRAALAHTVKGGGQFAKVDRL